jgi:hypothetical protein
MKKLFLVLVLALLVGCSGAITGSVPVSANLRGAVGVASSTIAVDNNISTIEGVTVTETSYEVYNNTGGAGSLAFGITAFGGDCSVVTPVLTVPVLAATNSAAAVISPEILAAVQTYYAVGQMRVCIFYTQTDVNIPLDLSVRIKITASKNYSYSTGL